MHGWVKPGICFLPNVVSALVCCYAQDKWMEQGGRKGGGEESQTTLCLELPHDLLRLLQGLALLVLNPAVPIPISQSRAVHQPLGLGQ